MSRAFSRPFTAFALLSVVTGLSAQNAAGSPNPRALLQATNSEETAEPQPRTDDGSWTTAPIHADLFHSPNATALNLNGAPRFPQAVCAVTALPTDGGSSANARAPSTQYTNGRSVYLITAAELAANNLASGSAINGIGWNYFSAPVTAGSGSLIVYLENTADGTNLKGTTWATAILPMTIVHNATTLLPGTAGTFDIPFVGGSLFTYTGGALYVAFDWTYSATLSTTTRIACTGTLVSGLMGAQSTTGVPPTTLAASSLRPETRLIPTGPANDASSDFVMTYGQVPMGLVAPLSIRSNVTNKGSNAIANLNVTLNITGANTFTNTQVVPSLNACGGTAFAVYAPFSPTVLGINTITASVPADDVNSNNSSSFRLDTTVNRYNYMEPGSTSLPGGFGMNGTTGALVGKFTTNVATQVDSVTLDFPTASATTYRVEILGNNGNGLPLSPEIYLDAADRTVTTPGPRTIRLPSPVNVLAGDFFVGIQQTSTTRAGIGYVNEIPIRGGSFFFAVPVTSTAWTDFSPGINIKLNLGVILGSCLVPLAVDVTPNGTTSVCPNTGVLFTAGATGGTGTRTYQWTENGTDIVGATASTYNAVKAASGSFTYNVKVTDDGGCINNTDATSSTATWTRPGEVGGGTVSGNILEWAANKTTLNWPAAAGFTTYTVYRGTLATLPALTTSAVDSCTRYMGAANILTGVIETPAAGDSFWYIVTGANASGCEGTAGNGTAGPEIVNSSGVCP